MKKKKNKLTNISKLGILLFGISLLLWNCEKEEDFFTNSKKKQLTLKTVSLEKAKEVFSIFEKKKETKKGYFSKKKKSNLKITPDWNSFNQKPLDFTDALLSNMKTKINVNTNFKMRLIFININNTLIKAIESIDGNEFYNGGKLKEGKVYFHTFSGNYLGGYRVEKGKTTKKLVQKKQINKASILPLVLFFQECDESLDPTSEFCDNELEEVVITANSNTGSNDYYYYFIDDQAPDEFGDGGNSGGDGDSNPDGDGSGSSNSWTNGDVIVENPDNPINDIIDYLKCFDPTQSASLTIYVNEPSPGTGKTHNGTFVGHTFISISQGSNVSTFGFYPVSNNIYPYINNSSSSILGDDGNGNKPFSASVSTTLTSTQLSQILNKAKNYNLTYHLDTYNCTDFAIDIGNLGGLSLPPSNGTWPGGGGSNPGTLGQHIRSLSSGTNTTGGKAPQTNKGC